MPEIVERWKGVYSQIRADDPDDTMFLLRKSIEELSAAEHERDRLKREVDVLNWALDNALGLDADMDKSSFSLLLNKRKAIVKQCSNYHRADSEEQPRAALAEAEKGKP
jgi:hypothetical protein